MKKSTLILFTKHLLDFMFFSGILVCLGVPFIFKLAGRYFTIFDRYYIPFCIIYIYCPGHLCLNHTLSNYELCLGPL